MRPLSLCLVHTMPLVRPSSQRMCPYTPLVRLPQSLCPLLDLMRPPYTSVPSSQANASMLACALSFSLSVPSSICAPLLHECSHEASAPSLKLCALLLSSVPLFSKPSLPLFLFTQLSQVNNEPPFPSFASFSLISRLT
jgi:hypothetical protein